MPRSVQEASTSSSSFVRIDGGAALPGITAILPGAARSARRAGTIIAARLRRACTRAISAPAPGGRYAKAIRRTK